MPITRNGAPLVGAALIPLLLLAGAPEPGAAGTVGAPPPPPLADADFLYDGAPPAALYELGRMLFFDPILSGGRDISCGACHDPALGTSDGLALGVGAGGAGAGASRIVVGAVAGRVPRNAQALWNIGARSYASMFHDGRVELARGPDGAPSLRTPAGDDLPADVESPLTAQAFFPVASPVEMAGLYGDNPIADAAAREDRPALWAIIAARVAAIEGYWAMLKAAYPALEAPDDVTYAHIAEALAAFQTAAFRSDRSPFDAVLRTGDPSLMGARAEAGFHLFYGKAGCAACHDGPLLTDHRFHAIAMPQIGPGKGHGGDMSYRRRTGLPARMEDEGRARASGAAEDRFAFRTPSLRNVALTGPWGHSGAYDRLEDVVRHHLDPAGALARYRVDKAALPPLAGLRRLAGAGSARRFAPLEPGRRADFDLRDAWVMRSPALRRRIAAANQLQPTDLADDEVEALIAFLHALTDPSARDRTHLIPKRTPSGLPPQPAHR